MATTGSEDMGPSGAMRPSHDLHASPKANETAAGEEGDTRTKPADKGPKREPGAPTQEEVDGSEDTRVNAPGTRTRPRSDTHDPQEPLAQQEPGRPTVEDVNG